MRDVKWLVCALAVCVALTGVARADDPLAGAIRASVETAGPAIVPLKVVFSVSSPYSPNAQEQESKLLGTVLDETGLIVTSNAAADWPYGAQAALSPESGVECEIRSASLIRPDGTEVDLRIVLRDSDLDLMFLLPVEEIELEHLVLPEAGAEPAVGDQLIIVNRLGAIADRQPAASTSRVRAVIDKPRRFYVTNSMKSATALGCPVFDADGVLVGLVTIRLTVEDGLPVILPLADILDDVVQAKEAAAMAPPEPTEPEQPTVEEVVPVEEPADEPEPEPMEEGSGSEGSGSM